LIEGAIAVAGGVALAGGAAALADAGLARAPRTARPRLRGLALKPALSVRALLEAGRRIQRLLEARRLDQAREALGRDLVSRDTRRLSSAEVAGAAIESVAENLSDGAVGPLLAFRLAGLSGAYVYRLINTADAMFGYHTRELEWFGKPAAVADDIVNLVPARLTALLIVTAAPIGSGSPRRAAHVAWRDARRTASPNAGWPMAAMAGALGVRLTKRGQYELNGNAPDPCARDIGRCCAIAAAAAGLAAVLVDAL
jgi:adenosylcobinamide-phosphate synthase